MPKDHITASARHLLRPVVRFLLRNGITFSEFSELAKETFVEVARNEYGIQGRPTNNSRVAMLTGLSRREVSTVRDRLLDGGPAAVQSHGSSISRILTGWHLDDEFTDADGHPKELPGTGPQGSLASLLKRYAGDLPHSAIRKEMLQRGLIEDLGENRVRVLRRDYVYSSLDPEIIRRMGVALHDHAATLDHNLDEERRGAPRFEALADNARVSPAAVAAFQELVESRGLGFLEEIDGWLSRNEVNEVPDTQADTVRLGVGVYLIYDET